MLMCMLLHWFYFIIDLTQLPVALSSFSSTGLDENQGGTVISTFIVSACLFLWSAALSRPPPVSFSPPPSFLHPMCGTAFAKIKVLSAQKPNL